jgi:hypothetical protein
MQPSNRNTATESQTRIIIMEKQSYCSDFSRDQIDQYDEFLDEIYDEICVGGLTFSPSDVIFNCDPLAYRIGLDEYIDEQNDE